SCRRPDDRRSRASAWITPRAQARELAWVEPDAAAASTEVDLDALERRRRHLHAAAGAGEALPRRRARELAEEVTRDGQLLLEQTPGAAVLEEAALASRAGPLHQLAPRGLEDVVVARTSSEAAPGGGRERFHGSIQAWELGCG